MAKRGRKPKEKPMYFFDNEEAAIVKYIETKDMDEKNYIFNTILYPAFTKMIESIIRKYKLFVPDEEFDVNFNDTISYLLTKIEHFNQEIVGYDEVTDEEEINGHDFFVMSEEIFKQKQRNAEEDDPDYVQVIDDEYDTDDNDEIVSVRYYQKTRHTYKAYSYCGTVCKNYLMYKCSQYSKKRQRNTPYDDMFEELTNNIHFSTEDGKSARLAEKMVRLVSNEIERMLDQKEEYNLTEEEVVVGNALVNILRNWDTLLPSDGSNKLQKSSVLYLLRENTHMTTKAIRDNMRRFKLLYYILKSDEIE